MSSFNGKKAPRFARLLPSVVALGAVVLTLKTTDLVHNAYAQAGAQANAQVSALTSDPVPAHKDFAGGEDDQIASASEVDVMNSLSRRRRELDVRDSQLTTQANMIAAAKCGLTARLPSSQLQAQIIALLVQRDDAQNGADRLAGEDLFHHEGQGRRAHLQQPARRRAGAGGA